MKAARLHGIGDFHCDEIPVPIPKGEELLIRVGGCGICGSDLPRVFSHGTSNGRYPLTIGHEFAGEVVRAGDQADPGLIGRRGAVYPLIPCRRCEPCTTGNYAMCGNYDYLGSRRDGGFAEYCLIPSAWHLIQAQSASMEALAMTEPACVAQHAVRKANVSAGQYVVIFGAGPIGIMAARWARIFGAEALLVDILPHKVAFAREKGFEAVNSCEVTLSEEIKARNRGRLADAAIEGTGSGEALCNCAECVRALGSIALLGNPAGEARLPMDIHSMIMRKELSVMGVWNSGRAPYPVDEWAFTVKMIDEGKLMVTDLITHRVSLDYLPEFLKQMKEGTCQTVKAVCV